MAIMNLQCMLLITFTVLAEVGILKGDDSVPFDPQMFIEMNYPRYAIDTSGTDPVLNIIIKLKGDSLCLDLKEIVRLGGESYGEGLYTGSMSVSSVSQLANLDCVDWWAPSARAYPCAFPIGSLR